MFLHIADRSIRIRKVMMFVVKNERMNCYEMNFVKRMNLHFRHWQHSRLYLPKNLRKNPTMNFRQKKTMKIATKTNSWTVNTYRHIGLMHSFHQIDSPVDTSSRWNCLSRRNLFRSALSEYEHLMAAVHTDPKPYLFRCRYPDTYHRIEERWKDLQNSVLRSTRGYEDRLVPRYFHWNRCPRNYFLHYPLLRRYPLPHRLDLLQVLHH